MELDAVLAQELCRVMLRPAPSLDMHVTSCTVQVPFG